MSAPDWVTKARATYRAYADEVRRRASRSDDFSNLLAEETPSLKALSAACEDYLNGRVAADEEHVTSADSHKLARQKAPEGHSAEWTLGWDDYWIRKETGFDPADT